MRTAQVLKNLAHVLMVIGLAYIWHKLNYQSLEFWLAVLLNLVVWVLLRLVAIMGQLIYEMRHDSVRLLSGIERSIYQSNAIAKETRDLIESKGAR